MVDLIETKILSHHTPLYLNVYGQAQQKCKSDPPGEKVKYLYIYITIWSGTKNFGRGPKILVRDGRPHRDETFKPSYATLPSCIWSGSPNEPNGAAARRGGRG